VHSKIATYISQRKAMQKYFPVSDPTKRSGYRASF